jgi:predicted DNA binding CopG/RHH family protein
MSSLKVPKFETEAEEAQWWFDNDNVLSDEFQKAAKEGRLRRGGIQQLLAERGIPFPKQAQTPPQPLPTTTIRLDPADIALARAQAAERGLRYQTYLKMIIHEALRKAETAV